MTCIILENKEMMEHKRSIRSLKYFCGALISVQCVHDVKVSLGEDPVVYAQSAAEKISAMREEQGLIEEIIAAEIRSLREKAPARIKKRARFFNTADGKFLLVKIPGWEM